MILLIAFWSFLIPKDSLIQMNTQMHTSLSDGGQTPFWLRSLHYGQIQSQSPGLGVSILIKKNYSFGAKDFTVLL